MPASAPETLVRSSVPTTITLMQLRGAGRLAAKMGTACVLVGGALALSATGVQAAPAAVANHPIRRISAPSPCITAPRGGALGARPRGSPGPCDRHARPHADHGQLS